MCRCVWRVDQPKVVFFFLLFQTLEERKIINSYQNYRESKDKKARFGFLH